MLDFNTREIVGRLGVLVCALLDFVTRPSLSLLAKNADDIESGAAAKRQQCELDRLWGAVAISVIYDQRMARTRLRSKLTTGPLNSSKT